LHNQDVNPRLVIGHYQIPIIGFQLISTANVPADFIQKPQVTVVEEDPNGAYAIHYSATELAPGSHRYKQFQKRYQNQQHRTEDCVDDVEQE
jgi:hypothetical protein